MSTAAGYLVLFAASLFFTGLINRVKAVWAGKKGAPLRQEIFDLRKLLGKGEVIGKTASFVFRLNPSIQLAAAVFSAALVPLPGRPGFLHFPGDFVLFAYTFGLAKFMAVIAALDTGSSFEGMGASREATFSTLVEPAYFILLGSLGMITGRTSFADIFGRLEYGTGTAALVLALAGASLFIMLLVEGSRGPVDDPNTHLELTMIHEVMVLDYSGPDLAYIVYASGLKMVLIATLLADVLLPHGPLTAAGVVLYAGALILIAAAVGIVESLMARARMSHVPQFIFIMTALSLTAFAVLLFSLRGEY
jgi:formate hydrogenlyase subunit 4